MKVFVALPDNTGCPHDEIERLSKTIPIAIAAATRQRVFAHSVQVSVDFGDADIVSPRISARIDELVVGERSPEVVELAVSSLLYLLADFAENHIRGYESVVVLSSRGPIEQALAVWRNPTARSYSHLEAAATEPGALLALLRPMLLLSVPGPDHGAVKLLEHFEAALVRCDELAARARGCGGSAE